MKKYIGMLLAIGILLTGCSDTKEKEQPVALPTQKSTMETLTIYSVDSDTMTLLPLAVKKEQSATPEYITSLVEDSFADEKVRVYSVKQAGKQIILSFYREGKPIKNCSAEMETLILDSFANSLLDNIDGCSEVIFQCEDKKYKSEHTSFQIDEVYASE